MEENIAALLEVQRQFPSCTNAERWLALVVKSKNTPLYVEIVEAALEHYPTSLVLWQHRIDGALGRQQAQRSEASTAERSKKHPDEIEGERDTTKEDVRRVFERAATATRSPLIWDHFLTWIQSSGLDFDDALFEKALESAGQDILAVSLWNDYIQWVTRRTPENQFEEGLRTEKLRTLYQRAVVVPMTGIESLWKEYDAFENNSANKLQGKKILAEKSGAYMNARALLKELKAIHDGINRRSIVDKNLISPSDVEQEQATVRWIRWEAANPLSLAPPSFKARLQFAFESALAHVRGSEKLWFLYHSAILSTMGEEGSKALEMALLPAIAFLPFSVVLHVALAEEYEQMGDVTSALSTIDALLAQLGDTKQHSELFVALKAAMRFARRTQYFFKARKLEGCPWDIYVLAAEAEFFIGKDPGIAFKIFELGMKDHASSWPFVKSYLRLLMIKLDDSNIKSLCERALISLSGNKKALRELFVMLIEHERDLGHLPRLKELSLRLYGDDDGDDRFWDAFLMRNELKLAKISRKRVSEELSGEELLQHVLAGCGPPSAYAGPVIPGPVACEIMRAAHIPAASNKHACH